MGAIGKLFGGIGSVFDVVRKIMHFIVLVFLFMFLLAAFSGDSAPRLPERGALLINPDGPLVEQLSGDPVDRAVAELQGAATNGELLREIVGAIDSAADDARIDSIVLSLESLSGGGITKLNSVGDALLRFRASGKKVYAYGDFYSQTQYYLAAHADEVYLHPSGGVVLDGYGRFQTYYREAIEKLQVDWNVFKVGEFKSFVEPYLRDDMSPEDRQSSQVWLSQMWSAYLDNVGEARGLSADAISVYTDNIAQSLNANGGDLGELARDAELIDALWNRDEFRDYMIGIVGRDEISNTFSYVSLRNYVAANGIGSPVVTPGVDSVGIVVASGQILDGTQPSGTIGGDSLARILRDAREQDDLKALVLVVDSGGGSKFASEVIQREILAFKRSGRPVVAYMSSVAASGGYWIAMDADEIWASPTTITGSIGIGGFFPTFQRTLDRLGMHVDGVGTTRFSGEFRPDRAMSEDAQTVIQRVTEHGYQQFINSVATARDLPVPDIDRIARGRVWSGTDAKRLGLVDTLGTLDEAIAAAALRADLGDSYGVRYVEKELTFKEQLALMFAAKAQVWFGDELLTTPTSRSLRQISATLGLDRVQREIETIARFNDPFGVYAYCFCRIE
ncbi:MAG: signal peptide peptidase SppA [Gammaproteobacteria bacterium]